MKITKRQLRRIIKEEKAKILSEITDHEMYTSDDELRELGDKISEMVILSKQVAELMRNMGSRYGQLVGLGTNARTTKNLIEKLEDEYHSKLDDIVRFNK